MQLAGYSVVGRIGAGSTGVVWLAHDPLADRTVAIKQLAKTLADDDAFRTRFRDEARALASLSSPNIVALYDYVDDADGACLIEEWVDGSSLARVLDQAGRLTPAQAVGVLRGALSGLAVAHEAGIVHGDLTPANILVAPDGASKLIDFGLSGPAGDRGSSGTPAYTCPEAFENRPLDARSDIYSAGCVLFELLSGRVPFAGATVDEVAAQHLAAPVPRVEGAHPALAALVARAMAKDPDQRPPDAAAFLRELEAEADRDLGLGWAAGASMAGLAIAATVTDVATSGAAGGPTSAMARRAPKRWLIAGGVAAGIVAVVAVAASASGGGGSPSTTTTGGDPAQQAAAAEAGAAQGSPSGATTGAPKGTFAITVSGDRTASITGAGTCSFSSGSSPTVDYVYDTDGTTLAINGIAADGSANPTAEMKAILGKDGFLVTGAAVGATPTNGGREVTVNADATGSASVSQSDAAAGNLPPALHIHVAGTVICR